MNTTSDLDESTPPPAYTEQEFDRKVSTVIQASLADDQEEWEEWDEAKFEAAATGLHSQSSTSSRGPSSSDVKKPSSVYPPEKQGSGSGQASRYPASSNASRPSNQALAHELHSSSSHSLGQSSNVRSRNHAATLDPSQSYQPLHSSDIHHEDEEDTSVPPPAFTGVGPSLDGPPYEEVVRYSPPGIPPRSPSPVWSSRREDILHRPSSAATSIHSNPSRDLRCHEESYNHPYPSTYSRQPTNYTSRVQPAIPRMEFNPAVAYGRPMTNELPDTNKTPAPAIDASAFYNSSISSYLSVRNSQTAHSMPYQTKNLPSNPNTYPGHFNRNIFTASPPGTLDPARLPRRPSYQHPEPGLQLSSDKPRWAMAEQQFPF